MRIKTGSLAGSLIILISMLSSCANIYGPKGFIHDHTGEYTEGVSLPPLKTPAGQHKVYTENYYIIPEISNPSTAKISVAPPGSLVLKQEQEKAQEKTQEQAKQQEKKVPHPYS